MVATKERVCDMCGKPLKGNNPRQTSCSNSCRQEKFRASHGLATPAFLQPKPKQVVIEKTSQVIKKVPNPYYEQLTKEIKDSKAYIAIHEMGRQKIAKEQARILDQDDDLRETLTLSAVSLSALIGVALIGLLVSTAFKDKDEKKKILGIAAIVALGAAIFSVLASQTSVKNSGQKRKMKQLEQLKLDADAVEEKALMAIAQLAALESQLMKLPKLIDQSEAVTHYEQAFDNSERLTTLTELANKKFDSLPMGAEYIELFGESERNCSMALHGLPGNGKSTFAINLAKDLAEHEQRVLFIAAEEGFSKSLQNKWKGYNSNNVTISNCRNISGLKDALKRNTFDVLFLDSVQEIKISAEQLKKLRQSYPEMAFVYVLQSTKTGQFKGSNEYAHDADVLIKIQDRKAIIEKSRYL